MNSDAEPIEPEQPVSNYAGGGGVRRIRKFAPRKRKREDLDLVLLIDRSSSMRTVKIEMAKSAVEKKPALARRRVA
jgi:Mg-chelatase subunit ChlD